MDHQNDERPYEEVPLERSDPLRSSRWWWTKARVAAAFLSIAVLFVAVVPGLGGRFDPELAVLTLTLVGLIWYTAFTYEAVQLAQEDRHDRARERLQERRRAALLLYDTLLTVKVVASQLAQRISDGTEVTPLRERECIDAAKVMITHALHADGPDFSVLHDVNEVQAMTRAFIVGTADPEEDLGALNRALLSLSVRIGDFVGTGPTHYLRETMERQKEKEAL